MAATTYRYKWGSLLLRELSQNVPGALVLGSTGPGIYVDVTADSTVKSDLDDFMLSKGWTYDSTAPATTVTQQSAANSISSPQGSDQQVQFNDGGAMAGAAGLAWDKTVGEGILNGAIRMQATAPSAPTGTDLRVFTDSIYARSMLRCIDVDGDYPVQPHIGDTNILQVLPGSGSTPTVEGCSLTTSGTLSHPALASTNLQTQSRRVRAATSSTAGNVAGICPSSVVAWRGNAAGLGGFHFWCHWGLSTALTGQRCIVGLLSVTSQPASGAINTQNDCVFFGRDNGDANLQLFYNGGTGNCTKVDLGANFARSSTEMYECFLFATANGSGIDYVVQNRSNGGSASGTITGSKLPTNTVFLTPHIWTNNYNVNSAAQIEFSNLYLETPI